MGMTWSPQAWPAATPQPPAQHNSLLPAAQLLRPPQSRTLGRPPTSSGTTHLSSPCFPAPSTLLNVFLIRSFKL